MWRLWELSFLPCEESCEVTKLAWQQLWQKVWQFCEGMELKNPVVPLKLYILCFKACIGPRWSKDPHPKDPCLSQRKAVKPNTWTWIQDHSTPTLMAGAKNKHCGVADIAELHPFDSQVHSQINQNQKIRATFQTSCAYGISFLCYHLLVLQIWFELANMKWSGEPRLIVSILTMEMSGLSLVPRSRSC